MKKLKNIEGIRALSVVAVILYHLGLNNIKGGYLAVDIFFVISGFLITHQLRDEQLKSGSISVSDFIYRRAKRLLPLYYLTLLISLFFSLILFIPEYFKRFGGEYVYASTFLSNYFFMTDAGYFSVDSKYKPLLHTWSLSVEVQFYIFIVLLFYLVNKFQFRARWHLVGLFFLIFIINLVTILVIYDSHLSNQFLNLDSFTIIFYCMPLRLYEFMMGALLSMVKLKSARINIILLDLITLLACSILIAAFLYFDENSYLGFFNGIVICGAATALIFSSEVSRIGYIFRSKPFVYIGGISYAAYLIHWPLIVFYKSYRVKNITEAEIFALFCLSIALGALLTQVYDKPIRNYFESSCKYIKFKFWLSCCFIIIVSMIPASTIWSSDGWWWRTRSAPPHILELAKDSKQFFLDQYGGGRGFLNIVDNESRRIGFLGQKRSDGIADFIVIGDSHATQLLMGVKEYLTDTKKAEFYFSTTSCLVLPGVSRMAPTINYDIACPAALGNGLLVASRNNKSTIILAERWVAQVSEAIDIESRKKLVDKNNNEIEYRRLFSYLDKLRNEIGDINLVIIGGVPEPDSANPLDCYLKPSFFEYDCNELLASERETRSALKINAVLKEYAQQRPNTYFINPFDYFCDTLICRNYIDDKPVYSDSHHLSIEGSRFFVSKIYEQLLKISNN